MQREAGIHSIFTYRVIVTVFFPSEGVDTIGVRLVLVIRLRLAL